MDTNTLSNSSDLFAIPNLQPYSGEAKSYRLIKETNGEYTLQGAFIFWDANTAGFEWRDIVTINREDAVNITTALN